MTLPYNGISKQNDKLQFGVLFAGAGNRNRFNQCSARSSPRRRRSSAPHFICSIRNRYQKRTPHTGCSFLAYDPRMDTIRNFSGNGCKSFLKPNSIYGFLMNLFAFRYRIPQPILQHMVIFVTPKNIEAVTTFELANRNIADFLCCSRVHIIPRIDCNSKVAPLCVFKDFCTI